MMEGLGLQAVALSDGSTAYIQQTIGGETISWKYAHSISIITNAVERLIAINRIQNKSFCLHNI